MNNKWSDIAATCWEDRLDGKHFDQEQFAELIIRECANVALRENHDPYECILKHFGIDTIDTTLRNRSTYYGNDL